jgi:3-deoxy-D-manno-octulosonic-acid transferase
MRWPTGVTVPIVAESIPAPLRAYRWLMGAAAPLAPLLFSHRLRRGKEHPARLRERRGETEVRRPPGPLIWVHGASVGEVNAVLPLIERLCAQNFSVLVTSGTVTSAQLAEQRLPDGGIHQFVPLDAPRFVARFLDHWQPNLGLFVESDLWPNLILSCSERGIPLMLVNGRLSERSFKRWRAVPGTIAALLKRFDLCMVQSAAAAERYAELGSSHVLTTGNLKLDVPAPPADEAKLRTMKLATGGRPIIAGASTHPGEEGTFIDAHRRLRQSFPALLTILVPRHPERGAGVVEIATAAGLRASMRSRGQLPDARTEIYVADTLGELGLVYRLAPIVFMGGSLASHGGQNPIEAVKLGAAILHGPHVWNFAEIYAALDAAQGAEQISDASKLAVRIGAWLKDPASRDATAAAGLQTVNRLGGALERTLGALEPYLLQLRLDRRLRNA